MTNGRCPHTNKVKYASREEADEAIAELAGIDRRQGRLAPRISSYECKIHCFAEFS